MRILAAALLAITLCACQAPAPERVVTHDVAIAVPQKCTVRLGPSPAYPDTDDALAAVPDVFQGVKLLKAGRILRIAREKELLAAAMGCGATVAK